MKRWPTEWEEIFKNHISDEGLISKIYKEFTQLNSKKPNYPILIMGRRSEQTFFQRRHRDGQQAHEKLLNIINLGKCKSKLQWLLSKWQEIVSVGKDVEKKGTLVHCWWECKLVRPLWKTVQMFLKNLKIEYHMIQQFHSWVFIWRKQKH